MFGQISFGRMSFGRMSFGLMSFGLMSFGLMSFGLMSFGLMSFGQMSFAGHLAKCHSIPFCLNESSINRKNVSFLIKSLIPLNDPLDLIIAARGIFFTVMWIAISNGGEPI